ncbi:aldo/keto reductase [Saccharopolyspora sp. 5N708]|uniref:aldo/keto reductase n=1 Tax=Saccharopolyspora sp. 5N708 TaxID=3457424 RepID=UPI003FD4EECC
MQHFTFGRNNGLRVSELALGTGNFGTRWGVGADAAEARKILDRFAEAGGTFLDTAESYQAGQSEEILGELLVGRRDQFTLATKFAIGGTPDQGVLATGNGRRSMVLAVEQSLRRLNTDRIELLWVHYPDGVTPIEEIVRGFDDLVRAGKILYGGLSNFPAWRTARAATIAELRGYSPIAAVQLEYSLVERTGDRDILPMAQALGLGAAFYSPLAGGLMTGKYRSGQDGRISALPSLVRTETSEQATRIVDAVLATAAELAIPPGQVATAWLRQLGERAATPYVTVIGPRTPEQLDDYLGSLDVRLDDDQFAHLDEVSRVSLGQPHDLLLARRHQTLGGPDANFRPPHSPVA